jgi:hypothetical protein
MGLILNVIRQPRIKNKQKGILDRHYLNAKEESFRRCGKAPQSKGFHIPLGLIQMLFVKDLKRIITNNNA